jgi:adenosylcobinamide-GDP ribazoletransferase
MSAGDEALAVSVDRSRHDFGANVVAAIGILTRLPVRSPGDTAGAGAFGLVGSLLGAAAGVIVIGLGTIAPPAAAAGALAFIALLSGGLHLDGLADTADALVAPTAEAAERARSDPRAGPAAVMAIVVILLADWSLIGALLPHPGAAAAAGVVVIAGAASRAAAVLAPLVEGRGFRPGFGSWFAQRVTVQDGLLSVTTVVALAAVIAIGTARPGLVLAGCAGLVGAYLWCRGLARIRHGLDGDALGAVVELTFTTTLLIAVLTA